jgi:hypothetical protein
VAIQTQRAKRYIVCCNEHGINLTMTGIAGLQIESGYIVPVTIETGKRRFPSRKLMAA